jgi:hypothetical protein
MTPSTNQNSASGAGRRGMTITDVAARIGVSRDTIERMDGRGDLPAPSVRSRPRGSGRGRCVLRWDPMVIERYMDARRAATLNN